MPGCSGAKEEEEDVSHREVSREGGNCHNLSEIRDTANQGRYKKRKKGKRGHS